MRGAETYRGARRNAVRDARQIWSLAFYFKDHQGVIMRRNALDRMEERLYRKAHRQVMADMARRAREAVAA